MTPSSPAAWVFWACAAFVAYAYAGYPLLVALLSRLRGRVPRMGQAFPPLTVVVTARNEQGRIAGRVADILAQEYPADRLRVLVVSDGSQDATATVAAVPDPRVRVIALERNVGKAAALNVALAAVETGLVAFTDARQRFAPGALAALVAPFADERIGVVSGELVIAPAPGQAADVGLYWRMEKRLREDEARIGWLHGVTGAIYALRRELYRPIPPGTLLDDVWVPMHVLLQGRRAWMARDAIAHDVASSGVQEEFRRKLRTLAGNWQLVHRLPVLALPGANPVFFAWFSHKFARLLVPWALLGMLAASAIAPGMFFRAVFALQLFAYAWAALALRVPAIAGKVPLLPAAGSFLMLNLAAMLSLPAALAGDPGRLWKKH